MSKILDPVLALAAIRIEAAEKSWIKWLQTTCESQPGVGIPFIPSSKVAVKTMLDLAEIQSSDIVYDLGCGDGQIIIMAAQKYDVHGVGIDIRPDLIEACKERAREAGVEHLVKFICQDFWGADIKEASVVVVYLISWALSKLRNKFLAELRPGSRIVSNTFEIEGWQPEKSEFHLTAQPVIFPTFGGLIDFAPSINRLRQAIVYNKSEEIENAKREIRTIAKKASMLRPEIELCIEWYIEWAERFYNDLNFNKVYLYRIPPKEKS